MEINLRKIHIEALLQEELTSVAQTAEKRNIQLRYWIQPGLKTMEADPSWLRQIYLQLISNAIKFNHDGGQVQIQIYQSDDGQWIVSQIEDTGVGIPQEDLQDMFQGRYTGELPQAGLARARQFVEWHGGTIAVKSEAGQGTAFTLRLPANPPTRVSQ